MESPVTDSRSSLATSTIVGSRRIQLLVFPVEEGVPWPRRSEYALDIVADGSRDTIGMSCVVEKSIQGIPNASTVRLWNLSEETRETLSLKGLQAEIAIADPYSKNLQTIFRGGIISCISDRAGADIITTLYLLANVVTLMTTASSFGFDRTPLKEVLESVKTKANLKKVRMYGFDNSAVVPRFSYQGSLVNALNKLAFQESFSWGVEGYELVALADEKTTGNVVEFTPDTGLIRAVPILAGPFYAQTGVSVVSYPCAWVTPGDGLKVESKINAKTCNRNDLKIATIKYNLSTIEDQWTMESTCFVKSLIGA